MFRPVQKLIGVFPDVDRDDSSLEGTVPRSSKKSFDAEISGKPFLLTDSGELKPAGGSVIVPPALFEVWPGEQAAAVLDDAGRPAFSRHVSSTDRTEAPALERHQGVHEDAVLQSLRTKHLPKPESWRRILNLWAYVAPELTHYRFTASKQLVRIVPVQGKEVLYSANEVFASAKSDYCSPMPIGSFSLSIYSYSIRTGRDFWPSSVV